MKREGESSINALWIIEMCRCAFSQHHTLNYQSDREVAAPCNMITMRRHASDHISFLI